MALYRVLNSLQMNNRVVQRGDFITSAEYPQKSLDKLEQVGAISLLHAPPLSELPDFDGMAEQLAAVGIISADQLLELPIDEIVNRSQADVSTVRQWRVDVANWLIIPIRPGG
jgi:hypothetical protein